MEEINRSYYAIIPANVRYDKELTANAKLLYGEITALCNEKGYCWASNSYFADLYQVSNVSISKWVNQLIKKGYLFSELTYKNGTKEIDARHLYIHQVPIKEKFNTPQTKVNEGIEEKFNTPIKEKFKDNNTIINNTFNNKERKKVARDSSSYDEIINSYTSNQELKETIVDFIKMRKLIKAPMTNKALKLMLKKLTDLATGKDDIKIAILNQSIENSWKGIFELKVRGKSNGSFGQDPKESTGKWAGFKPTDKSGVDWENEWEQYKDNTDPDLI